MSGADAAGFSRQSSSGTPDCAASSSISRTSSRTPGRASEIGVVDRCELIGGSFFEAVPSDGDAYVLRNIIHDWDDDQAVAILMSCRRSMTDGARLVLVERYLATDPHEALLVLHADLEMLVNVGGRERTTDEYAALLVRSGLRLTKTIALGTTPAALGHQLIEAQLA
jgi:hypothetical protein